MRVYNAKPLRHFLPLFFIIFIDTVGYFLAMPVLLRLFVDGHQAIITAHATVAHRDLLYSFAVMLAPLAFLLASPLFGYVSDWLGRKKTLAMCLVAAAIGFVLPVIAILQKQIWLLLVGRFIGGASTCSQPVAQAAITDFTEGRRKAFYFSLIALAMTLAMVLGPIAGSYLSDDKLVSWFNLTTPFWFGMGLAILNLVLLLLFFKDDTQILAKHNKAKIELKTLWKVLRTNKILALLAVFLCFEIAWSLYYQAIFLFLTHQFHYTPDQIGLFTGYIGIWMSLGLTFIYKFLVKRYSVEQILKWSLIGATLGFIGCSATNFISAQWIFVIPTSIFIGTAYPSLIAMISNRTAADHQGWALGTASFVMGLSWMLTAFMAGALTNLFLILPLLIASLFSVIATIFIFNLLSRSY